MSLGGLNRVELLKLQKVAGVISAPDIILLLKHIEDIEKENERLQQKLNDKQSLSRPDEEAVRTADSGRSEEERVRKGTKVRRVTTPPKNN